MIGSRYLLMLGVSAAAGTALGMLSDTLRPVRGGLLGMALGAMAGSAAAGVCRCAAGNEDVPYYSSSSPLYEDPEAA